MSASGYELTGRPVSSPAARAAVMSAAAWSRAVISTPYSKTNLSVRLAVMQARTGSSGVAARGLRPRGRAGGLARGQGGRDVGGGLVEGGHLHAVQQDELEREVGRHAGPYRQLGVGWLGRVGHDRGVRPGRREVELPV